MKILVDINNKILKVLENDRSIFKGEKSADKLILYINQQLVNEYPVITGLLSNGRRIGPFTTDSSYGTETIDGITYTTAEFTLSKENGFTLTEGNTQVTIWIYKTKDTEVISKNAIGNVTFNVVNTTSFNDGDIIISGDVEGTVVNIKVELENLQSSVNAVNSRVNNLNGVVVKKTIEDISNNKTLQELYDEYGSCFVGKVGYAQRNVLFLFYKSTTQTNLTVCSGSNLKTYENVNMNLNVASLLDNSLSNPTYSNSYTDKEIDELIANLKSSKVSIYMPSYSVGQGDEVVIRQRLTYDILTQPYTSSIIVAGGKYIAYLYIKGGTIKQVKLFDFISNAYYETSDIDTSKLTDYNTISFKVTSYYDAGKIDSLMLLKADKSTTYTKTETDSKTIQNLTINSNDYTNIAYQLLTMLINETINRYTTYYVNKRFEVVIHSSYGSNYGVYIKDITNPTEYFKTNFIDITTNFSINDVQITRVEWYDTNEVDNKLTRNNLISAIGEATESLSGIMSAEDKKNLNTLVALLQDDENDVTDTIKEILTIFEQYPEGANLAELLAGKADKADTYSKSQIDSFNSQKVDKTTYESKVEELEENISDLDNIKIEIDSLTAKNNIKNYQEVLWLGSDEIPEIPTQLPFGSSTDLITFLEGLKNLWTDIDSELIEQYGYDRVVFLGYVNSIKKLVKCTIRYYESSGTYAINVHSSIYKANVKECISLNTNKRYKLINDTYETPQEPSYFLEEIPYLIKNEDNRIVIREGDEDNNTTLEMSPSDIRVSTSEGASANLNGSYGSLDLYAYGWFCQISPEDNYIILGNESEDNPNVAISTNGVSGKDVYGNGYGIDWQYLQRMANNVFNYVDEVSETFEFDSEEESLSCELHEVVNTNFPIVLSFDVDTYYLIFNGNSFRIFDDSRNEYIHINDILDGFSLGGTYADSQYIIFKEGFRSKGTRVDIYYIKGFSPFHEV